ncbi:uncharacterized protein [Aristolochia californica]|uniref:uncharacterized protein n=1 Tax=Aristolochia californica TaxID=171875 RepID=UPI0035DCEF74
MADRRERFSHLSSSPSFNSYSANRFEEIAARVINELAAEEESDEFGVISADQAAPSSTTSSSSSSCHKKTDAAVEEESKAETPEEDGEDHENDSGSDDFEFTFVVRDPDASPISADEIFANGQIRPMFPLFNRDVWFEDSTDGKGESSEPPTAAVRVPLRKLFIDDREPATSSSEAGELEALPAGSYCVWTPRSVPSSPDRCKKSNSTGSSKRWRFRDLLHRSSSDGKETFLFLSPSAAGKDGRVEAVKGKKVAAGEARKAKSSDKAGPMVSAHELHYVRNRAIKEGDRRRSFLPYRQDIVGFFANVNGLSRTLHPF